MDEQVQDQAQEHGWPQRAMILAGLGALMALAVRHLLDEDWMPGAAHILPVWRQSLSAMLVISGLAFGFTLERTRIGLAAGFSLVCGLVIASVVHWNIIPETHGFDEPWRAACAIMAISIAVPLFQAWRSGGGGRVSQVNYAQVHDRAWRNLLTGIAAVVFTGITWGLGWLLAELFKLIGLRFIEELLQNHNFAALLTGAAIGGAIGLLRDRDNVIGGLQRVVMMVLSVLAPLFGAGLVLFLLSLPFTGLVPLWQATRSTTPILLTSCFFAFFLANAAIGDSAGDEAKARIIRWGAMALGVAMLPLAVIAGVSTAKRIGQYGMSPDRLWASVFVGIAAAVGLAYLVALVRRRMGWAEGVRPANLKLGMGLCGVALLLSTPIISFGAISARSQMARLSSGKVDAAHFDWTAMKFDFGAPGRAALKTLAASGATAEIKTLAAKALATESRYDGNQVVQAADFTQDFAKRVAVFPKGAVVPPALIAALAKDATWLGSSGCGAGETPCTLKIDASADLAIFAHRDCERCQVATRVYKISDPKTNDPLQINNVVEPQDADRGKTRERAIAVGIAKGDIEYRTVTRHQVFIGGKPVGEVID